MKDDRIDRHLDWDGCFNARDLGGLRTVDGRTTRRRALVRSETLDRLTAAGWSSLWDYGIRTIVDLRNDDELSTDRHPRPTGLRTVHMPLDHVEDTRFWDPLWRDDLDGTPLYYRAFLEQKPERCAAALAAIARAQTGGVLFHCRGGRDRTGLVAILILALVGVEHDEIVADYELSNHRLPGFWATRGMRDQRGTIDSILASNSTTARALLLDLLCSLNVEDLLRDGGLTDVEIAALRDRLRSR